MSNIYLVRHGITAANKGNRFAGRSGEQLHPEGIMQIRQVAQQLKNKNISTVYCGPSKRTVETAEILAAELKVPFLAIPDFDEINIPHWDGLTKEEIRLRFGDQYPTWLSTPETFHVPGCETLAQVQNRAVDGIRSITPGEGGRSLLLVSHLIVLRCLFLYFKGLGLKEFRSVKIDNGSVLKLAGLEDGNGMISFLKS